MHRRYGNTITTRFDYSKSATTAQDNEAQQQMCEDALHRNPNSRRDTTPASDAPANISIPGSANMMVSTVPVQVGGPKIPSIRGKNFETICEQLHNKGSGIANVAAPASRGKEEL